jgi:hypothetical protein
MTTKRIVNGQRVSIPELVDSALAAADVRMASAYWGSEIERARQSLRYMGHTSPDEELVTRYARETVILAALARTTGANFSGQIGKISFSSRERAIADVESYLNRRNQGQRSRWTASH